MIAKSILFFIFLSQFSSALAISNDTLLIYLKAPNGNQECAEMIQKALNTSDKRVLKIVLRKGKYVVGYDLKTSRDNLYIQGEKGSEVYFKNNSGIIVQNNKVVVDGIKFEGNGTTSDNYYKGYAILLNGADYCVIKNNVFQNIAGNNIFLFPRNGNRGSSNNIISNNSFFSPKFKISRSGDEGVIILGYSGTEYEHNYNVIENNFIDGDFTLKVGIGLIGHGHNNIIRSNTIKNLLSYGIVLYESKNFGYTLYNNEIINNSISNVGERGQNRTVKGMGIYLMSATNSVVLGNKINNVLLNSDRTETLGAGAISVSLSSNSIIKNNSIDGSEMYGIVSDYSFDTKFVGNNIKNVKKSAMYIINTNNIIISENHVKDIGETVFKGYFENTGLDYIKAQLANKKFHNLLTGKNIKIHNNNITSDNQLLFFRGTSKYDTGLDNKIGNNSFINNTIIRSFKKNEVKEDIAFRETMSTNYIKGNKIIKR